MGLLSLSFLIKPLSKLTSGGCVGAMSEGLSCPLQTTLEPESPPLPVVTDGPIIFSYSVPLAFRGGPLPECPSAHPTPI